MRSRTRGDNFGGTAITDTNRHGDTDSVRIGDSDTHHDQYSHGSNANADGNEDSNEDPSAASNIREAMDASASSNRR